MANPHAKAAEPRLSRASVGRFSLYLRHLEGLLHDGSQKVSSSQLGDALGVTDAQVRKDLACLGSLGHPGIGYSTGDLIDAIRRLLGVDRAWRTALVGVGNLGRALLRYRGFDQRGFRLVAPGAMPAALSGHVWDSQHSSARHHNRRLQHLTFLRLCCRGQCEKA